MKPCVFNGSAAAKCLTISLSDINFHVIPKVRYGSDIGNSR